MLKIRLLAYVFGLAAGLAGLATGAAANTVTVTNTTDVESYQTGSGGSPINGFFGNSDYWGQNVGGPNTGGGDYQTSGLTATYTAGNGTTTFGSVTLSFNTLFQQTGGVDAVGNGLSVYAADIFIKSNAAGSTTPPVSFNYAISLGYTATADGGLAEGLYGGTITDKTSNQVWGNANIDAYYGGAFAPTSAFTGSNPACSLTSATCSESEASPTVLTGGTAQSNIAVSENWNTSDTVSVTLTASNASGGSLLSSIFSDFDIFWGTGDCSNAPIFANIALQTAVPEPSSLALLLTAAIGFALVRRRKRMLSSVA